MEEIEKQTTKIDSFYKTAITACIDQDFRKLTLCYHGIRTCLKKIDEYQKELKDELFHVPVNEVETRTIL